MDSAAFALPFSGHTGVSAKHPGAGLEAAEARNRACRVGVWRLSWSAFVPWRLAVRDLWRCSFFSVKAF